MQEINEGLGENNKVCRLLFCFISDSSVLKVFVSSYIVLFYTSDFLWLAGNWLVIYITKLYQNQQAQFVFEFSIAFHVKTFNY